LGGAVAHDKEFEANIKPKSGIKKSSAVKDLFFFSCAGGQEKMIRASFPPVSPLRMGIFFTDPFIFQIKKRGVY